MKELILSTGKVKAPRAKWQLNNGHGAWSMGLGAWGMELGAWGMEHGAWSMGHGAPDGRMVERVAKNPIAIAHAL